MSSVNRAARTAWPRRLTVAAAGILMVAQLAGCSHHKSTTSYRPIYTSPSSGCATCGSSGTSVTTEGASVPAAGGPTLSAPSADSAVTPSASVKEGSGSVRSSTVEAPPKAKIGPEPEWDSYSPTRSNSAKVPSTPPAPASPGAGPALTPPSTDADGIKSTMRQSAADPALAGRVDADTRPASGTALASRLEPYIAGSSSRELFYPTKAERPWRFIVLHHSASTSGSYDDIDREHRKVLGFEGCGYHFVIGNGNGSGDGQIEVAQRWNTQKQGVHCRNARSHDIDEYGIGICLVGDFEKQPPTPRQIAATQALIAYLSRRYQIDASHVSTHAHVASSPTACPGKYFPSTVLAGADLRKGRAS